MKTLSFIIWLAFTIGGIAATWGHWAIWIWLWIMLTVGWVLRGLAQAKEIDDKYMDL